MKRLFKVGSDRHDTGKVTFEWHPDGNFLASAGKNGIVQITDRNGEIVEEISMLQGSPVLALAWDKDGEYLAILQDGNAVIPLWNLNSRKIIPVEASLKDPTFLAWSQTGPQLAVGTMKGTVLIYNKQSKKKTPVVGKHSKRIGCGSWSKIGNKLVLGSEDKTITVSNDIGDTLLQTEVKNIPTAAVFTSLKGTRKSSTREEETVCSNLDGKSLILFNILDEKDDPIELTFGYSESSVNSRYGEIKHHICLDDGLILVGFSLGYLVIIATNAKELGQEKFSGKFHGNSLSTFAYNPHLKKVATAGDDGVRIIDIRDFKESKADFISRDDLEDGRICALNWTPDGSILTVGTSSGNVYNFLAKMTLLSAKYKSSIAFLSSLRELSIVDGSRRSKPIEVSLKLEPAVIAIGARHAAAGMNNRVYFHRLPPANQRDNSRDQGGQIINEQEYLGTVRELQLNDQYAAVLTGAKATLHPIEPSAQSQEQTKIFPTREEGSYARISCMALTDDFFIYGTEAGTVELFYLHEWMSLAGAELRLDNSVKHLFPNASGTRIIVVDSQNQIFLFNPVSGGGINQSITRFEAAPSIVVSVLWDIQDQNVIMIFDGTNLHTYVYVQHSIKGSFLTKLGPMTVSSDGGVRMTPDSVDLPANHTPLSSSGGILTCQKSTGGLSTIVHSYFDHLEETMNAMSRKPRGEIERPDMSTLTARFCQCLALSKLEAAWVAAIELNKRPIWLALSGKAMELLNIELAVRVYRQLGDAGMVASLLELQNVEDRNLLAGHISLLFNDFNRAQELFLASSYPIAALQMRRDLLHWDVALKLAQAICSVQIPDICIRYGQQLELRGEIEDALRSFEMALNEQDANGQNIIPDALVPAALMGMARCQLRLGNYRAGLRIANEHGDKQLFQDCGDILQAQKQYAEAAAMHIKAEQFEKAAYVYTKYLIKADKSKINEAASLMERVQNDQLNSNFAKVCAAAGRYDEAARAYERAKDYDMVIQLKIRNLDQVQQAFDMVRSRPSAQGAQFVADYCVEVSDYRGAIEFLLLANKSEEAFKLAQAQGLVDVYCNLLGESIGAEDALKVAHYFEKQQDFGRAGKFYSMSAHYGRALKLFIQCGDREIDAAIEVVGKSQSESLTHQLIDFLVGETDGVPKDPNYIYRLYMALKKYDDAAKTALIIARQEQDMGNYDLAHSVVFETIRKLEDVGIKVNLQLRQAFVLLHSYLRAKYYVSVKEDLLAARLSLRIAQSVSKFPQHAVGILTTTVIECHRAGLKVAGHEYAMMLMRPENRASIRPEEVKKRIEQIVRRKPNPEEETPEDFSPCPISGQMIPTMQLECPSTRDALPMCIITGQHMVLEDWCFCPNSKCPALYSAYVRYIETYVGPSLASSSESKDDSRSARGGKIALDPVLKQPIATADLRLSKPEEATKYIRVYNNVIEEKRPAAEDEDEAGADAEAGDKGGSSPVQLDVDWGGSNSGNVNPMSAGIGFGPGNGASGGQDRSRGLSNNIAINKSPVKRSKGRGEGTNPAEDRDRDRDRERDRDRGDTLDSSRKPPSPRREKDRADRERDRDGRDGRDGREGRDRDRERGDRGGTDAVRSKRPVK